MAPNAKNQSKISSKKDGFEKIKKTHLETITCFSRHNSRITDTQTGSTVRWSTSRCIGQPTDLVVNQAQPIVGFSE